MPGWFSDKTGSSSPGRRVRLGMALGAAATIALIAYGVVRFPTSLTASRRGPMGLGAGLGIAVAYGLVGWFGVGLPGLGDPRVLREGLRFGLLGGGLFSAQMLGEYLVPHGPRENGILALATFGLFFLILASAGFAGTRATGRLRDGPLAALWGALISSQAWFILLLGTYYAFIGTAQEARFLEVDQVMADFARSGMGDLRAFLFEDFMGGGFFHSLLGPLFALPLGGVGGLGAGLLRLSTRLVPSQS